MSNFKIGEVVTDGMSIGIVTNTDDNLVYVECLYEVGEGYDQRNEVFDETSLIVADPKSRAVFIEEVYGLKSWAESVIFAWMKSVENK